jgi:hypothetical protein
VADVAVGGRQVEGAEKVDDITGVPPERQPRPPLLNEDDDTANREYTRQFVLDRDAETGKKFGLAYAEAYHYIGPPPAKVEEYVRRNAVKL